MKVILGDFPDFSRILLKKYKFKYSENSFNHKIKYSLIIMAILFYLFSFGLGFSLLGYDSDLFYATIHFSFFIVVLCLPVSILHLLIQCLIYPCDLISNDCIIGFSKKYLCVFSSFKGALSRNKLILISSLPFLLITILPLALLSLTSANMFIYAVACVNGIISAFDLYDLYFLIRFSKRSSKLVKIKNVLFEVIEKHS